MLMNSSAFNTFGLDRGINNADVSRGLYKDFQHPDRPTAGAAGLVNDGLHVRHITYRLALTLTLTLIDGVLSPRSGRIYFGSGSLTRANMDMKPKKGKNEQLIEAEWWRVGFQN